MPCRLSLAKDAKKDAVDIVAGDKQAYQEINDFLLALPGDPLPARRMLLGPGAFYLQLPCGVYVAWEIIGDMLELVTQGPSEALLVRVLGFGREKPRRRR